MAENSFKIELGKIGEKLATEYLEQHGYDILDVNFRAGHGEIDIIAKKDQTLIFVEVKTSKTSEFGNPITWVTRNKQRQIGKIAQAYLLRKGMQGMEYRFDVIGLIWEKDRWNLEHVENAFWL